MVSSPDSRASSTSRAMASWSASGSAQVFSIALSSSLVM
jgi:hypothetical protein